MNAAITNTLNSSELIEAREYHMKRLEELFDCKPFDRPYVLSGYTSIVENDPLTDPDRWAKDILTKMYEHAELLLDRKVFRPLCPNSWLYGVHFIDKVFGANVFFKAGQWWSEGVKCQVGELPVPDLEHNETWLKAKRLTEALVAEGVSVPFYSTQVLGEPWNQTFNLYRERALMGFYDNPDGMRRDLGIVTDIIIQMHQWYQKTIPPLQFQPIVPEGRCQPRGYGQMCGCSTQLISNNIYVEFIKELDERVLSLYPHGGMLHLCGRHLQHLHTWKSMSCIRSLQLNDRATEDLYEYYNGLRKDQILYVYPTERMTPAICLEVTENGRRMVLVTEEIDRKVQD